MKKFASFISVICLLINSGTLLPCLAAKVTNQMDNGLASYAKGDYKNAIAHFGQELKLHPNDCDALYYQALSYHQLKDIEAAKKVYRIIVKNFPYTEAARNSHLALMYLDPEYAKLHPSNNAAKGNATANAGDNATDDNGQGRAPDAVDADLASLPNQARVPYEREGENLVIKVSINGRPIDMFFDSGAEAVVIRKSELESLGIKPPSGKHIGVSYGIGDGGGQRTWISRVSVKVGPLERKNFPLHVQEDPNTGNISHPLLGQSFFKDFSYTLEPAGDGSRGTILFQKKNASGKMSTADSSVIPFTNMGKDILVPVEINGKKMPMIFDTGAEICVFTKAQLAALGLSIPDDAQQGIDQGIAGTTSSWRFTVPRMRLGSVIKNDIAVSVVESSAIDYPLLGNSFLGGLRMDIDNDAHLMRVRR